MDFLKLFGTVMAFFLRPGNASKLNGERICRRGTERPCYKAFYIQDSRRRLTFEDARKACRLDGGELLSIETESEQKLMERFIKELKVGDGNFWIGLHRNPQHQRTNINPACPSQYYWLDGSKAKYRNWHWDEPSCGSEMCAVLYHQPFAPHDEEGHFLFQWNDDNCSSKNNFLCKYREEKLPVIPVSSQRPNILPTTDTDDGIKIGQSESSVSFSENNLNLSYILCSTIPALLLLLFAAAGFFCYKHHAKRRKTDRHSYPSRSKKWVPTITPPCPIQGPYAFSDIAALPQAALDSRLQADSMEKYSRSLSQCDDYENVSSVDKESGFVTNDIYEACRTQSRRCCSQDGWVENEIYG